MNTITAIEALEAENAGEGQDVAESKKELHYITTLGDYPRNAAVPSPAHSPRDLLDKSIMIDLSLEKINL